LATGSIRAANPEGRPSLTVQFRTVGVGAKFSRNRSLAFILLPGRVALRSPRFLNQIWQLLRVASRDTVVDLHERIAKIYIPLFLGIS